MAKDYDKKISSSYNRGRRRGYADAAQYERAPGTYVAASVGHYVGMHDYRKVRNAKKTSARYTDSRESSLRAFGPSSGKRRQG